LFLIFHLRSSSKNHKSHYPLHLVDETVSHSSGFTYLSCFFLFQGFLF
jgi:hypothetical protein